MTDEVQNQADPGSESIVPQPSTSFGRYLLQQRELRAMSRDEVSKATRIALSHIAALEEDRLEDLPGEAFVVGFIRSYADCIGLNADDTVLRFQEQQPTVAPAAKRRTPARSRSQVLTFVVLLLVGLAVGWVLARH